MAMKRYIWIFFALFCVAGCESLEDTYSDYAGDGPIRYVGKCTGLKVTPGWESLHLQWVNSVDALIANIKVTWSSGGVVRDTLLPKDVTTCDLRNLADGNYQIRVCSVNADGETSLEEGGNARPYTMSHEVVLTFTRVVLNYFYVGDRLVLFFDDWNEKLVGAKLNFTRVNGEPGAKELTKEEIESKYFLLPEPIDPTKAVTVERRGYIEGCDDLITFDPFALTPGRRFTTDFTLLVRNRYGVDEVTDEFVESCEELDIDYSLASFEDILYFPKLKKLNLAKNRFQCDFGVNLTRYGNASQVYDLDKSLFVLDVAHELMGLEVDRYNTHFLSASDILNRDYITAKGNPSVPQHTFLDTDSWSITCSVEDVGDFESNLEYLIDGDLETAWMTEQGASPRLYEIDIDMGEPTTVTGVQIGQRVFDVANYMNRMYLSLMPGMITIRYSMDGVVWYNATGHSDDTLGDTMGEVTEFNFPAPRTARYLRFIVSDMTYYANYAVTLGEIRVF